MNETIDLSATHLATLLAIIDRHLPACEVRAFGSRVTGTAKSYSDLDLALVMPVRIPIERLALLREDLQESELPMRVDILDWQTISDSFRKVIERRFVVLRPAST